MDVRSRGQLRQLRNKIPSGIPIARNSITRSWRSASFTIKRSRLRTWFARISRVLWNLLAVYILNRSTSKIANPPLLWWWITSDSSSINSEIRGNIPTAEGSRLLGKRKSGTTARVRNEKERARGVGSSRLVKLARFILDRGAEHSTPNERAPEGVFARRRD